VKKSLLVRQRDLTDCGAACVASVCAYYGLFVPVPRIRQLAGTDKRGTSILGIVQAAAKLGLEAKAVKATFESLPEIPRPAIVHVIIKDRLSHYMVLTGITKNTIEVMDPAAGTINKITLKEFKRIWTGIAVFMMPGDTFQANKKNSNLRKILELVRPHHSGLLIASLCAVLVSLLGLTISIYVKEIVDIILPGKDIQLLILISVAMMVLLLFRFIIGIAKYMLSLKISQKIDSELILGYYRHLLHLPQNFFDNMRVGEMVSRINDAVRISALVNEVVINIVVDVLIIVFSLALMIIYKWKLAMVMLLIVPVYLALFYINDSLNKKWQRRLMESGAELDSQLVESLTAAGTVKRLGLEKFAFGKTSEKFNRLLKNAYSSSVMQIYIHSSADLITGLFTVIILWTGSYYVVSEKLSAGELFSFYSLIGYFTGPVLHLLAANKNVRDAMISADRLFEIMDLDKEESGKIKLEIEKGMELIIEFRNVSFRYGNGENVLNDINILIRNGTITGIKGKSGCGKSTLAALLVSMYKPTGGSITINGINIGEIDNSSLRELIVSVPQHTDLFTGTIAENITIGCDNPDKERLLNVAEMLGITEYSEGFPEGIDTKLNEHCTSLSGGQKQRIAIARAIYREARVLIMDEATASIDAASENKIMQTIEWYKNKGNTVIIIAHSDSTLKICDNIAILENGFLK
jgi:ATP-binding cassette subfamily B protein